MSGLGRTAASGFAPTGELLFLACPSKSNQKERHPKTCWDFQSQSPRIKRKTGTRELAGSKASNPLKQTLAMFLFYF